MQSIDTAKIKLQMGLNKRMYESGKITYKMYSRANEILISRLTSCEERDIIVLNERQLNVRS